MTTERPSSAAFALSAFTWRLLAPWSAKSSSATLAGNTQQDAPNSSIWHSGHFQSHALEPPHLRKAACTQVSVFVISRKPLEVSGGSGKNPGMIQSGLRYSTLFGMNHRDTRRHECRGGGKVTAKC